MGSAVVDAQGGTYGHVREFAVAPSVDSAHIHGIVIKRTSAKRGDRHSLVPVTPSPAHGQRSHAASRQRQPYPSCPRMRATSSSNATSSTSRSSTCMATRSFASTTSTWSGRNCQESSTEKWQSALPSHRRSGGRHARRRPPPPQRLPPWIRSTPSPAASAPASSHGTSSISSTVIPARRVRLNIEQDRLSKMHPSDIADILEELAPRRTPGSLRKS